MNLLNRSPLWPSFFKRVARIYKGLVSYAAWDRNYFDPPIHLLPVKQLGMDMYLPIKLPPNASAKRVTAAWERPFRKLPRSVLHRTAIDETGIQARNGAYRNPPFMYLPGTENENVQANWFHAACATVHRFHMRGVYFWKVDLTDYPAHPATSLSTFEGRKAAENDRQLRAESFTDRRGFGAGFLSTVADAESGEVGAVRAKGSAQTRASAVRSIA